MPYIAIKSFPKDEETKKRVVDKINEIFLQEWGCPQEAISISLEEVQPENWSTVVENDIIPNKDNMMIFSGKKEY